MQDVRVVIVHQRPRWSEMSFIDKAMSVLGFIAGVLVVLGILGTP